MTVSFSSKLIRPEVVGAWTFALVPKAAAERAGFRPRMRVRGSIEGVAFRSSLIPRGGGVLFVVVNNDLRNRIGKTAGDSVRLELGVDPTLVTVPPAFRQALARDPKAKVAFEGFTASQRQAYARWISDAKQDTTRARRVSSAVDKLHRGEKFN